jgi:hypothetical protein
MSLQDLKALFKAATENRFAWLYKRKAKPAARASSRPRFNPVRNAERKSFRSNRKTLGKKAALAIKRGG